VDDLDQLHHRSRVEKVQTGHPLALLANRHQRRHRQRGGIGGQQRLRRDDAFQPLEQRFLDIQIFDDGLDDQIAIGDIAFVGCKVQ
jgi:hypothetical protein